MPRDVIVLKWSLGIYISLTKSIAETYVGLMPRLGENYKPLLTWSIDALLARLATG